MHFHNKLWKHYGDTFNATGVLKTLKKVENSSLSLRKVINITIYIYILKLYASPVNYMYPVWLYITITKKDEAALMFTCNIRYKTITANGII